jgi:hypothetical protein
MKSMKKSGMNSQIIGGENAKPLEFAFLITDRWADR